MNDLFNNIFEQYAMYAIKEINPNLPTFDYNFQKICSNLDMGKWYNVLKLKPLPELEIIFQALLHSNYQYLNSDPLHSTIVLDLKNKIEQQLHQENEQQLQSANGENFNSLDANELKTKIKCHPFNMGYLALDFDYRANFQFAVKEFCLASFAYIVHEQNCVNWLAKLKYYVEEMKLTKLYVQKRDIAHLLRRHLNIPVIASCIKSKKNLDCCYECKRKICTVRQIKFYFKKNHSFYINYHCCPK